MALQGLIVPTVGKVDLEGQPGFLFQNPDHQLLFPTVMEELCFGANNESVVVADRIRENFRHMRKVSVQELIDNAITRTMSRTIITHETTETMVLAMLNFVPHGFALALTIGIVFGIYSSIFVMAPITLWLGIKREDLIKPVKSKDEVIVP